MTTIHDVAREVGVSVSTVSRALRGIGEVSATTRAAIKKAADDLGYVPSSSAAGLATGRHMTVAIVVPTLTRWFYAETLAGIDEVLRDAGYDILLINIGGRHGERERLFHSALLRKRVDAVVALAYDFTPVERAELHNLAVPVIAVGGRIRGVRSVGIDDAAAANLAVERLLELGHTRIAHIGGNDVAGFNANVPSIRESAWRAALSEHGVIAPSAAVADGGFTLPRGKAAARALLTADDMPMPTALFCASDEMAFGAILAARELGLRIPEDLSIVGIDDHPHAVAFGLSTVRQQPAEQGRIAAGLLLKELGGRGRLARSITAEITYVERQSVAPLNSASTS